MRKSIKAVVLGSAFALLYTLTASPSLAATVTFQNLDEGFLPGVDRSESQMNYAIARNFVLSASAGNPPSALVGYPAAQGPVPGAPNAPTVFSTFTGRDFTFDGYDIAALGAAAQGDAWLFRGLLGNALQFSFLDTAPQDFATRTTGIGTPIDRLEVWVQPGTSVAFAADNFRFTLEGESAQVPEPAALPLLGLGLGLLVVARLRRRGVAL
ncbi:PEP-CTERM sorting domain-containing protein [Noviherbaspirillum sp. 1P10PC]|uniref:PEP-CTERM sorting domain-containing protein n=1 Tax=Noviherbaspirillum sp. 1P10PC TaxID=3132292 RepID=UPI0039A221A0